MVKLNKIYTRTGDDGTTGLGTGARVPKTDPRVAAYGEVDEANAAIGMAAVVAESEHPGIADTLRSIQHDLFDAGADLCVPASPDEPGHTLRVTPQQVDRIEALIDRHNANLAPLTSFVLPGGTPLAASLHVARTVTRRAERAAVALHEAEPDRVGPVPIAYLNRLSDLLFVLARTANDQGQRDALWTPGANRAEKPDHTDPHKPSHTSRDQ